MKIERVDMGTVASLGAGQRGCYTCKHWVTRPVKTVPGVLSASWCDNPEATVSPTTDCPVHEAIE